MSTHKHIDKICCIAIVLALVVTVLFVNGESFGIISKGNLMGYENRIFSEDRVHTVDIVMDDWEGFIETCENEEYVSCSVVIDGESFAKVGIRAKGNTSLSSVSQMDSDRYSFKIEFDQYDNTKSYYGLDKISLNNVIQDNTFMKDYLTYKMMGEFGVAAPLCSYVYITVNGEDFGLYLAVEGIEDSFLQRNYGTDYGELYKPDSMSFGGGRGNGKDFDFSKMEDGDFENSKMTPPQGFENAEERPSGRFNPFADGEMPDMSQMPEDFDGGKMPDMGGFGGMGSDDVKLKYIDDDFESYKNIFDNAKTDITDADKTRLIESLKVLSSANNVESVVNIEQVIKYFVVHNFVVNGDSYTGAMIHNYYLYEKDGVMEMLPWDYNLAFGTFQSSDALNVVNESIDSPVSGDISDRPMIAWIFENEEYTKLYHEYFSLFINEFFDNGYVEEKIDKIVSMISPYVEKDPTKFCDYESFIKGSDTLKKFCVYRAESVRGQLNGTNASVDASDINISDMGTMSMGGRGNMPSFDNEKTPQNNELKEEETTTAVEKKEETTTVLEMPEKLPQMNDLPPDFNGEMPEMPKGEFNPFENGEMNGDFPIPPEGMSSFGERQKK